MNIFYTPDISTTLELPETEAQHCTRVLRLKEGDKIILADGKGYFYKATINQANSKHCTVYIDEKTVWESPWQNRIHIAIAPTKNMDRMEWFAEKATEIGINKINFLNCRFSERREIKTARIEKVMIAAMKQSMKATLPELQEIMDFDRFITREFNGQKYIAHCYKNEEKKLLSQVYKNNENVLILIGPEGDFSEDEINAATKQGFIPISLGESRLRTETAALTACQTIHIINQLKKS